MTPVTKVTISLPAALMAHIEGRRRESGAPRSAVVADLLWRGWRQLEGERREERSRAAYQAQPETAGELAWADMAADELLAGDKDAQAAPGTQPGGSDPNRRAAG